MQISRTGVQQSSKIKSNSMIKYNYSLMCNSEISCKDNPGYMYIHFVTFFAALHPAKLITPSRCFQIKYDLMVVFGQ